MDGERSFSIKAAVAVIALPFILLLAVLSIFGGGQTSTILSKVGAAIGPTVGSGVDGSGDTTGGTTPGAGGTGGVDDGKQIADAAGAALPELLIVRTGQLEIVVPDLAAAVADGAARVSAVGGYVSSSEEASESGSGSASVVYRIPAARWDDALAGIRGLASQTRRAQVQTEAVTSQVVDLGARIANLRSTEAALQAIMVKASTIKDVLEVQRQLGDVRGQVEQLVAEKASLEQRAAFGTLTVVFSLPVTPKVEEVRRDWDPAADIDRASGTLIRLGQKAASAGIWLAIVGLPLLLVVAVVAVVAWRFRRIMGRWMAPEPGGS
jgi:hypothetical protein